MVKVALSLDASSRAMVMYLLPRRHASLDELAAAAGLRSHMEALRRIREVINPAARRALGKDVLVLKRVCADPVTGDPVTYHWWLEGVPGPMVEAVDSGGEVSVFVLVPEGPSLSGDAEIATCGRAAVVRLFREAAFGGDKS